VSSKVTMGVVNIFEACGVFQIKVTFWPIPIWYGLKGELTYKNYKDYNLLSSMVNEGLIGSTCSLLDLSLSSTGLLTIMVTRTNIIRVWIGKGMCRNPSLGLVTKARACKGAGQEGSPGVTFHAPRSVGECEGMNPHTPKWTPTLKIGVPMDSQTFREWLHGSKPIGLKSSLYH
jgi:hypothetical protein